jgi:hypothetical protein
LRRYRQRVDANQPAIVAALRAEGCTVAVLNDLVDLAVGFGGLTMLAEVKDGNKPLKKGRQQEFHDKWTGGVYMLRRVEDAKTCADTLKRWHKAIMTGGMP